jgi:heme-degrading monooxygenase HmoA
MFVVVFEVNPKPQQWDAYLNTAEKLRPELEQLDGFIDNIRYKSLTRRDWILSLSSWRDEKALVRWRTRAKHHEAQQMGRDEILKGYHLRVGQIIGDNQVPKGLSIQEQRLDETQVGEATALTIVTMRRPSEWNETSNPADCAEYLGLDPRADGLLEWDVFDAVLTPGDLALLVSWRDNETAERFEGEFTVPDGARIQRIRVIRDYGMFDRREAPQYYPDADGAETIHG